MHTNTSGSADVDVIDVHDIGDVGDGGGAGGTGETGGIGGAVAPWAVRPYSLPVERVAVDSLCSADSPRLVGENVEHIRVLAESGADLPPILVHRPTMRVVDGMHRLRATALRGEREIAVRFLDGPEPDVFVVAVRANTTHGLPLTRADRNAAATRIIRSHPQWSDRMIASFAGLSPKTVGSIRRRLGDDLPAAPVRIGRDGRTRPVDGSGARSATGEFIRAHPDATLRQIAGAAGVSRSTARDVRRRLELEEGEPGVPMQRSPVFRSLPHPGRGAGAGIAGAEPGSVTGTGSGSGAGAGARAGTGAVAVPVRGAVGSVAPTVTSAASVPSAAPAMPATSGTSTTSATAAVSARLVPGPAEGTGAGAGGVAVTAVPGTGAGTTGTGTGTGAGGSSGAGAAELIPILKRDPSIRFTDSGRLLLRLLDAATLPQDEWSRLIESLPAHCVDMVAHVARACGEVWLNVAQEVDSRAALQSPG